MGRAWWWWLCEGLLWGVQHEEQGSQGRQLKKEGYTPGQARPARPPLAALMDDSPCQPMHGHYSLQDSKSPIHYSKAYFFSFFHSSGA